MGTLTAGQPRLDHYCEHKLPTSCRLSSIGECCACYDNRPHAASYSVYVDGVGYVPRGTRWQRYCWFCKEYWQNRVDASGLRPGQTRIPEVPDQGEFLQKWYEFHQGFRVVKREDGCEERMAVLGEDFRDVSPGFLPRTLEELRAGRERSELEERERELARQQQNIVQQQPIENGPTLDETLDQLFQAAAGEEAQQQRDVDLPSPPIRLGSAVNHVNVHAQAMVPVGSRNREYQVRRIAALRRELHRMRSGIERVISGLRDLGENVPDYTGQLSQLGRTLDTIVDAPSQEDAQHATDSAHAMTEDAATSQSDRTLASMQARVDEARRRVNEAQRNREQAASELDAADLEFRASQSRLRQLQNEQRTAENYMRLFGTREEMVAQGENYESPIGGMFTRAWERFRVAEEVRREERTLRQVLAEEDRAGPDDAVRLFELAGRERDVWGVPHSDSQAQTAQRDNAALEEYHTMLAQHDRVPPETVDIIRSDRLYSSNDNFPNNMLAGIPRHVTALSDSLVANYVGGPPGEQLDEDPATNNDRGLDAAFVLRELNENDSLMESRIRYGMPNISGLLSSVENNCISSRDLEDIAEIMQNISVIWTTHLPAERNRRRRERGETVSFSADAFDMAASGQVVVHDVEIMAETFQMSSQIRRLSGLNGPEQLAMLFRLQRGERIDTDREVLSNMLQVNATVEHARQIHEQHHDQEQVQLQAQLDQERRVAARQGNHTRAELDAQRRATRASTAALAAGRAAMADGPAALFERLANRDAETRAAYQRLQENGFTAAHADMTDRPMSARRFRHSNTAYRPLDLDDFIDDEDTGSEEERNSNDDRVGLDAKDSGRPEEALTEEQMTVLLDCRICYTQKADVCTLPCGHLTMCRWCSDQHSPTMAHDRTRPRRAANCPVCRKQIRQKVRVIRA